ncbi:MAG: DUF971 domain-containing protein [Pirellulales bacterium]|nr:DUF971 domain-containing protein [Pirellulales bacterium]
MTPHPTNLILKDGNQLTIAWSDGQQRAYTAGELRKACPCATCREERSQPQSSESQNTVGNDSLSLPVISMAETQPLSIADMRPVGSYAYGIQFSDGHDTGIFTLEFLRELGEIKH